MKKLLSILTLMLTASLQGCLFGGNDATPPHEPGPVENFLINAAPGASTTLDDPQFGPQVQVLLEDIFTSATGEDCKRATVRNQNNEAEVVVICKNAQGVWRLAPRVWGQGLSAPDRQKAVPAVSTTPASTEPATPQASSTKAAAPAPAAEPATKPATQPAAAQPQPITL